MDKNVLSESRAFVRNMLFLDAPTLAVATIGSCAPAIPSRLVMPYSRHPVILERSQELQQGAEPNYRSVDIGQLAAMELGSAKQTLLALRNLETHAWAQAEYCLVREVGRLLGGDKELLEKWSALHISEDPAQLQTKDQLLAFLARIVLGTFRG